MLVDMLVGGEDPLSMARYCLSQFAASLVEAWTPEEERAVVGQAARQNMTMVDHAIIGDYDLVLWKAPPGAVVGYLVSINNSGHNPLNKAEQISKFKGKAVPLTKLKAQINTWLEAYDTLVIGSYVSKRNILYMKLFKRLFPDRNIKSFYTGDYQYGFSISK